MKNGNEYWSDQYYLKITNGTVRAGDFVMANVGSVSGKLGTDINGTGQLIIKGDVTSRLAGYKSNGWMTAYSGDPNYVLQNYALGLDLHGCRRRLGCGLPLYDHPAVEPGPHRSGHRS